MFSQFFLLIVANSHSGKLYMLEVVPMRLLIFTTPLREQDFKKPHPLHLHHQRTMNAIDFMDIRPDYRFLVQVSNLS